MRRPCAHVFLSSELSQKEKIKNKTALGYVSRKRLATLISLLRKRERPTFRWPFIHAKVFSLFWWPSDYAFKREEERNKKKEPDNTIHKIQRVQLRGGKFKK
jgi:hypothetical protein